MVRELPNAYWRARGWERCALLLALIIVFGLAAMSFVHYWKGKAQQ